MQKFRIFTTKLNTILHRTIFIYCPIWEKSHKIYISILCMKTKYSLEMNIAKPHLYHIWFYICFCFLFSKLYTQNIRNIEHEWASAIIFEFSSIRIIVLCTIMNRVKFCLLDGSIFFCVSHPPVTHDDFL